MLFSKGRIPNYFFDEKKEMEKIAQRTQRISIIRISRDEPFREPDEQVGDSWAVWYGPGGVEGEHATEVESNGYNAFDVGQYVYIGDSIDEEPEGDFEKTTAYVNFDFIANNYSVDINELEESPNLAIRWAAQAGIDRISNEGGDKEYVDDLPQ